MSPNESKFIKDIYRDVDGFYYFDPPIPRGAFSAELLREIANKLDEMNKPWIETLNRELGEK